MVQRQWLRTPRLFSSLGILFTMRRKSMCHLSTVRVPKEQAGTTRSRVSSPSDDFLNRIACRSSKIVMHCFSRIPFAWNLSLLAIGASNPCVSPWQAFEPEPSSRTEVPPQRNHRIPMHKPCMIRQQALIACRACGCHAFIPMRRHVFGLQDVFSLFRSFFYS